MNESGYEEYKKNLHRDQKQRKNLRDGKIQFVLGICFLVYTLVILPFHADNVSEIAGNEMKAGKNYYPEHVYYIYNLEILRAKTDADDGEIYCIARFPDRDQNDWIISFTPGNNQQLAERIRAAERIRTASAFETELNLTVSGYFQLKYLEDFPFEADSFFSVYGRTYANDDGSNMLSLNAKYLCEKNENYTLEILFHPGIPLGSLVAGLLGTIWGSIAWIRNRKSKTP